VQAPSPPSRALLEAVGISKRFGRATALEDVSTRARAGEVTCLLGDNGAGKTTLIKVLSGVLAPDTGACLLDGREVRFSSPREARRAGIATVHQDLALVPLLSVWRNFVLGTEPRRGRGPLARLDVARARDATRDGLASVGVQLDDLDRTVVTLSGGERQAVAIARALYFGARVLILDEPTAALGVAQAERVLELVRKAAERGLAVILVTHNLHHALRIGDTFVVLNRGRVAAELPGGEVSPEVLQRLMAGSAGAASTRPAGEATLAP
jgi:simple sugar transport system ATP-binding protein